MLSIIITIKRLHLCNAIILFATIKRITFCISLHQLVIISFICFQIVFLLQGKYIIFFLWIYVSKLILKTTVPNNFFQINFNDVSMDICSF